MGFGATGRVGGESRRFDSRYLLGTLLPGLFFAILQELMMEGPLVSVGGVDARGVDVDGGGWKFGLGGRWEGCGVAGERGMEGD